MSDIFGLPKPSSPAPAREHPFSDHVSPLLRAVPVYVTCAPFSDISPDFILVDSSQPSASRHPIAGTARNLCRSLLAAHSKKWSSTIRCSISVNSCPCCIPVPKKVFLAKCRIILTKNSPLSNWKKTLSGWLAKNNEIRTYMKCLCPVWTKIYPPKIMVINNSWSTEIVRKMI